MKKFILMIILTASFMHGCAASDTANNTDNNDLSQTIHAYSDVLSQKLENSKSANNKLAAQLIYLNNDEIPELVIFDDDKAPASVHIYTFQNDEAIELTSASDEDSSKEYYIDKKSVDEVTFSRLQAEYEDKKPDTLNYNDAYPISSKEDIKEFTRHLL